MAISGLSIYREQMALTRSPATPTAPANATVSQPMLGNDRPTVTVGTPVAGDGLKTGGLMAIVVSVFANTGATLSGGGSLFCWIWDPDEFLWKRASDLDLSMAWTGGVAVQNARVFPALRLPTRAGGRVLFLTNAVTVSAGTDILVKIQGESSWHAS